jgi:alkyl sulfatase BDS1-like metallo-beta-lactamase superfamily hydrolase
MGDSLRPKQRRMVTGLGRVPASVAAKPSPKKQPPPAKAETPKKTDSVDVDSLISAGKRAKDDGEYDKASALYQKALQAEPGNAKAQAGLNDARQAKKAEEEAH